MTVQELINELQALPDPDQIVHVWVTSIAYALKVVQEPDGSIILVANE